MKKKILSALMISAMIAGMMSGCGVSTTSDESANANASGSEADVSAPQSSSEDKVEVEFWYSGGKTAVNVVQEIVDEFNASQDTYYVTTVTQGDYNETYQSLQAGIAGGVAPDLALIEVEPARNLYSKGLLANLNDYIDNDSDFAKDDYIQVFYNQGVSDSGDVFALPAYGTTQVMYYNKAVWEAVGIDPTTLSSWQELAEACRAIKDGGYATYGWEPMWGEDNLIDASLANGAKLVSDDGKTVLINSKEWVEVWESFRTWIADDQIMAIHSGGQGWEYWYATLDDAVAGTAGGYFGSSGDQADLDFTIVGAMEQPGWNDNVATPAAEAKELVCVGASSDEEKQGAYEFMKYFTLPENQAKWSMETGYVAVRLSTQDVEDFKAYADENPQILVPLQQASHAAIQPIDPTGGEIYDALATAADKVEIEGISAQEALDEACAIAQEALDKVN